MTNVEDQSPAERGYSAATGGEPADRAFRLTFADVPPAEGSGFLLHYEHDLLAAPGWVTADARTIISGHEDEWLEDIDRWHRELSARASALTQWWGLVPGSRLLLWATTVPFTLKPLLYAKAVAALFDEHHAQSVWIIGAPAELRTYLCDWAAAHLPQIRIEDIGPGTQPVPRRGGGWRSLLKQVALTLRYVAFRPKHKTKPAKVVIHSLILNPDLLERIGDHFFGFMLDETRRSDAIWLYNDIVIDRARTSAALERINRSGYFISDFFRLGDLAAALREALSTWYSLRALGRQLPVMRIGDSPIPSFARNFCSSLVEGMFPLMELIYYRQFVRILRQSKATMVIFPYEEKPLERAMLMAVRDSGTAAKTVGFAHAAYSKGHMYLRRGQEGEPLRPSRIAVTGPVARRFFARLGVPDDELVCIGSPRHHDAPPASSMTPLERSHRVKALLLIGHGFELRIFAAMVECSPSLFDGLDVLIRRYPYGWIAEQNAAEARLKKAGFRYRIDDRDLLAQIDESDIVLFESTSAAMEAVFRGKVVVQVNLTDTIRTNQFLGANELNPIEYCSTPQELRCMLSRLVGLTQDEYRQMAHRQHEFVSNLYAEVSPMAVKSLLDE